MSFSCAFFIVIIFISTALKQLIYIYKSWNSVRSWIKNILFLDNATDKVYIMMEARTSALFKKPGEFTVLER